MPILLKMYRECQGNSTENVQQQPTQTQFCVELYSLFVDSSIYYICRFLYVMPTLLKVYSNNQPKPSTVWSYTVCLWTVLYIIFADFCMWCQLCWKCTATTNWAQYCVELYNLCVVSSIHYIYRFLYVMPTLLKVYSNNQPNPVLCGAIQFLCRQFYILYLQISVCDANSTESVQQQPAQPISVWSYTVCLSTVLYIIFTYICMWCQLYWQCTATTRLTQYIYYGVVPYSLSVDSCIYYIDRFLYVMPTLLKVYSNNQPNPVLCGAIQFVCRQFYILHRKPFMLQVIVTYFLILEKTQQNLNSCLKHFLY